MQLNVKKIDERIQKLQEIRRIASDPELVTMLFEFIATEEERPEPVREVRPDPVAAPRPDHDDIVNQVLQGIDGQGSALLRKRA